MRVPSVAVCMRLVAGLVLAGAEKAAAQGPADSFEQLRLLVRPGDTVSVTDTAGREVTGTITVLSSSSLTMLVNGTRQDLTEREVATIRRRRSDSLWNGAIWGLVSGAALSGALISFAESDGAGDAAGFVAAYGAVGLGIGVGVDALITHRKVIYERPATRAGKVSVSPMWGNKRQGVLVTMNF
jgi:hypothetical protein